MQRRLLLNLHLAETNRAETSRLHQYVGFATTQNITNLRGDGARRPPRLPTGVMLARINRRNLEFEASLDGGPAEFTR